MPSDRDIAAFDLRAPGYELGLLGQMHREIMDRVVTLALADGPGPVRILDVGCGTGYLLRGMAQRCPQAERLVGIDPAPGMLAVAEAASTDPRVSFTEGMAEALPLPDATFDLVLTTMSFDHWADQAGGVGECARLLAPGGRFVLADLISPWLVPTLVGSRRTKARTKRRAERVVSTAGLQTIRWHRVYPLIQAVVAQRRPGRDTSSTRAHASA